MTSTHAARSADVDAAPVPGTVDIAAVNTAYGAALQAIEQIEPRIAGAIRSELADQRSSLKLIASENYASPAVLLTMGNWLSDKYAEGTVGHRFYAGCDNVDVVESVAAEQAARCSGPTTPTSSRTRGSTPTWSPSGRSWRTSSSSPRWPRRGQDGQRPVRGRLGGAAPPVRRPADAGDGLDAGGHLTHGFRHNISGKMFHQRSYGTDPAT